MSDEKLNSLRRKIDRLSELDNKGIKPEKAFPTQKNSPKTLKKIQNRGNIRNKR